MSELSGSIITICLSASQSRSETELDQSRYSGYGGSDSVPNGRVSGRIPGRRSRGSKSGGDTLRLDCRTDVSSVVTGVSTLASPSRAHEAERAVRHFRCSNNSTGHRRSSLCFVGATRMVCASLDGGCNIHFHGDVLCLDKPGNPFPLPLE